jgi:hypothetical protein
MFVDQLAEWWIFISGCIIKIELAQHGWASRRWCNHNIRISTVLSREWGANLQILRQENIYLINKAFSKAVELMWKTTHLSPSHQRSCLRWMPLAQSPGTQKNEEGGQPKLKPYSGSFRLSGVPSSSRHVSARPGAAKSAWNFIYHSDLP